MYCHGKEMIDLRMFSSHTSITQNTVPYKHTFYENCKKRFDILDCCTLHHNNFCITFLVSVIFKTSNNIPHVLWPLCLRETQS